VRNKRILLALFVLVMLCSGCTFTWPWTKKVTMTRSTPDGLYQQGVGYYRNGDYKKAVEVFQRLKEENPLSELALMAEIGIADSYFSNKDYPEAGLAYREFMNLHPTNENLPYVMYQLGMCHFNQMPSVDRDQSEAYKALKEFERLTARFPGSKFSFLGEKMIRECKKILGEQEFYVGEFYFNRKQYLAAILRFEKIARDYANVGLDYKVGYYISESKRRLIEEEAKQKSGEGGLFPPPIHTPRRGLQR
jgi:outer membrane protein assembly factor BamD